MKMTWIGFLRGRKRQPMVSSLLCMGGRHPSVTLKRINANFVAGCIDDESYELHLDALHKHRAEFADRDDYSPPDDVGWDCIGEGCYRRKTVVINSCCEFVED